MKIVKAIMEGPEALHRYLKSGEIEELNSNFDNFSNDNATYDGNDEESEQPQSKRFRGSNEDFDSYDNSNSNEMAALRYSNQNSQQSNSSGGNIPSLLNINIPPPINSESQNNGSSSNGTNASNNQKPATRSREGRRTGSRWSSKR